MLFFTFLHLALCSRNSAHTAYTIYFFLIHHCTNSHHCTNKHHCTFSFTTAHFVHHCTLKQALMHDVKCGRPQREGFGQTRTPADRGWKRVIFCGRPLWTIPIYLLFWLLVNTTAQAIGPQVSHLNIDVVPGAVHKVRHAIYAQFWPPSPCHTLSHIPDPTPKAHLDPRFLVGLVQKTRTKAPCTNSVSIVRGGFCPTVLSGRFCPGWFLSILPSARIPLAVTAES